MKINTIIQGDTLEQLRLLPDQSVNCCVTSPPYWNLRDYGIGGQYGLEKTPKEYIARQVEVFREVKRVLRKDGTLWVNIGDSYYGGKPKTNGHKWSNGNTPHGTVPELKPKDLVGIPWALAFALRDDGWYLRQDIIWHKPNPMPGSAKDRCTSAHEYIFLLSKSRKYFFDAGAIKTPYAEKTHTTFGIESKGYGDGTGLVASENWARDVPVRKPKMWKTPDGWDTAAGAHGSIHRAGREKGQSVKDKQRGHSRQYAGFNERWDGMTKEEQQEMGANKRSVWTVAPQPFPEAHFATFPPALITDCIKAGCPEGGIILDPYMGAGTTALVARKLNRNYIGIELNPEYINIAEKRLTKELGMFI